jgi:hypothetical protein
MQALPVIQREILVQSRRPGAHRLRVGIAAVGLAGIVALLWFDDMPDSLRGQQLYAAISMFSFAYALLAGVLLTADAITGERTQGTLGLLFLTDLKPGDILLGKLIATSLSGIYVLLGLLPLLAVPLMFGGVALWQVAGHAALLAGTLLVSLAVGLWASTVSHETGPGIAKALGVMAAIALLPAILGALPQPVNVLGMASPLWTFALLLHPPTAAGHPAQIVFGLVLPLIFATAVFVSAARRLGAADADQPPAQPQPVEHPPALPPRQGPGTFEEGGEAPVQRHGVWGKGSPPPEGLLESDPILWLLWRRNRFPRADAAMIGVLLVVALPTFLASLAGPLGWGCVAFTAFLLHLLAVCHMASQACQRIRTTEDREALELLLTTPRAARGTLTSYHRGFCQLFTPQFWALITVHGMLLLGAVWNHREMGSHTWVVPAVALGVLYAERSALSWVSLSLALRYGRYHRALAGTLVLVLVPSWSAVGMALFGSAVFGFRTAGGWTAWWVWLLTGCVWPLLLAHLSRARAARWLQDHGAVTPESAQA